MKTLTILPVFLILFLALAAVSFAQETGAGQPVEQVKEQVRCLFIGSSSEQSCYSESWKCTGTESCSIGVSGEKNKALTWKSTCGNFATTTIDGNNEEITFKCEQAATTQPAQPVPEQVSEQVTCLFQNSNSQQKCYSTNAVCYGTSSCTATVSGEKGKMLVWMSSCSGTATTTVDGANEEMKFACEPQVSIQPVPEQPATTKPVQSPSTPEQPATTQPVQSPPTTVLFIKEQVKCIFTNSNTDQKCYTDDGRYGCAGSGSCIADVGGGQGTKLSWKSTCSGNAIAAITVVDGNNEYAEFKCEQSAAGGASGSTSQTVPATPVEAASEQVKCMFVGSTTEQTCYGDGVFKCAGTGTCVAEVSASKGRTVTWKSTCSSGYAYTVIDGNSEYAEFNCGAQPSTGGSASGGETVSTVPARPGMSEKVWCIFLESSVLANPHAGLVEECYTDDQKFGCRWDGNVAVEENGKRYAYCVADSSGEAGTKLTWKSTCGGYAYSVMDNKEEHVEFKCVPSANVTMGQISGKGFTRSYWQCYDNAEQKQVASVSVDCMTSEMWQERATGFCKNHCSTESGKCGVNSFSVSEECYIDITNDEASFITPIPEKEAQPVETEKAGVPSSSRTETAPIEGGAKAVRETAPVEGPMVICKDSCPLDGKCYPFGYRKAGSFCYDDGAFRGQLAADSACENNFECTTNLCVDSKCMSSGMIQRILSWFKSLFG